MVIEEEIRSLSNVELAHTPVQPCKLGPKLSRVSHIGIGTKISIIVTLTTNAVASVVVHSHSHKTQLLLSFSTHRHGCEAKNIDREGELIR